MSIDYQVIEELTVPLRNVINYEAHNKNDSDMYQKLVWAQKQINTSLEEIQNVVCTYLTTIKLIIFISIALPHASLVFTSFANNVFHLQT